MYYRTEITEDLNILCVYLQTTDAVYLIRYIYIIRWINGLEDCFNRCKFSGFNIFNNVSENRQNTKMQKNKVFKRFIANDHINM